MSVVVWMAEFAKRRLSGSVNDRIQNPFAGWPEVRKVMDVRQQSHGRVMDEGDRYSTEKPIFGYSILKCPPRDSNTGTNHSPDISPVACGPEGNTAGIVT